MNREVVLTTLNTEARLNDYIAREFARVEAGPELMMDGNGLPDRDSIESREVLDALLLAQAGGRQTTKGGR